MTKIIVIAKSPIPGRVKTRLCPPCSLQEAALIAETALRDTLEAAKAVGVRTVLVLDGPRGRWVPEGVVVLPQEGIGLDERIAAAFRDVGTPSLLIGMDTPQVSPELLSEALHGLTRPGVDAVLGEAVDGGWWAAGVRRDCPEAFVGVPMSTHVTGRAQLSRFRALGWSVASLPRLRDVDTFADALLVANEMPETRFAAAVRGVAVRAEAATA